MNPSGIDIGRYERILDFASKQHRVVQENLANINTPGYKAKTLHFDDVLGKAILEEREGINPRQDGNTVVLEVENAEMKKNALVYRMYLTALGHDARMVRTAIAGRTQ
jgi:flagellar basal-body rod protein FlgB